MGCVRVGQTVPTAGHGLGAAGKRFVVQCRVDISPVEGPAVGSLATESHIVGGPRRPLKCAAGLGYGAQVGKQVRGLRREGRSQYRSHGRITFRPQAYVRNEAAARPLCMAARALRLQLPGLRQELPHVHVILREDFLHKLRRNRAEAGEAREVFWFSRSRGDRAG